MAKLCPETVTMTPNEKKYIDMDFAGDLDVGRALASIVSIAVSSGGPASSLPVVSTSFAQHYFDASGVSAGADTVTIVARDDTSGTAQDYEGIGRITVAAASL